jgi:PAS domain-containing protein
METIKKDAGAVTEPAAADLVGRLWEHSWTYIKTVVDIVREPVLILDKELKVMAANESFYRTFQVDSKDTEKKLVYDLGNGQWDIPDLRKLLENILPKNTFFKGFEVIHQFPSVGRKVMILNARQIYPKSGADANDSDEFPPIILLAMEDVTEIMVVAETLATHANKIEIRLTEQTKKMATQIQKLEKEIVGFEKKEKVRGKGKTK